VLPCLAVSKPFHRGEFALLCHLGLPPLALPLPFLEVGHAPLSLQGAHALWLERQVFNDLTQVLASIEKVEDDGGDLAGVGVAPGALPRGVGCREILHPVERDRLAPILRVLRY